MLIRQVPAMRGLQWLGEGFVLFGASPLIWVVVGIGFMLVFSLLSLVPVFGSIAATLIQPVLVAGLLQGCRDLDRGEELRIAHLFWCFHEKTKLLLMLGLILGLASVAIVLVLIVALFGTGLLGAELANSADWTGGWSTWPEEEALAGALLLVCLALLLSLPLAMAAWFAPALILFQNAKPWEAMKASVRGCLRNLWPFLTYGLGLGFLLVLALIPLGLGLLVFIPLLFSSLYASYNDIYRETP